MKAMFMRLNPAFKLTQPIPLLFKRDGDPRDSNNGNVLARRQQGGTRWIQRSPEQAIAAIMPGNISAMSRVTAG